MRLKPDGVSNRAWMALTGQTLPVQDVAELIFRFGRLDDRDQVERLVRASRGETDEDGVQQQEPQPQQQQAAPEADIQQNHSMDTGDTLTTPSSDPFFRETQQQPTGAPRHDGLGTWGRLLGCLFPWMQESRPPDQIGSLAIESPVGPGALAGALVPLDGDGMPLPLNRMGGGSAVNDASLGSHGNASRSTVGLPLSEDNRPNPQEESQSGGGGPAYAGIFLGDHQSE
uniref:Uncharacterized protein n=2 Tax=Entomoneis paludosa TaxID=265537 RepID=A0A7S2YS92_9STRA